MGSDIDCEKLLKNDNISRLERAGGDLRKAEELRQIDLKKEKLHELQDLRLNGDNSINSEIEALETEIRNLIELYEVPDNANVYHTDCKTGKFTASKMYVETN